MKIRESSERARAYHKRVSLSTASVPEEARLSVAQTRDDDDDDDEDDEEGLV